MADVLKVTDQRNIPVLNELQCGTYPIRSWEEAQKIAKHIRDVVVDYN